jgi:hypothetical protein
VFGLFLRMAIFFNRVGIPFFCKNNKTLTMRRNKIPKITVLIGISMFDQIGIDTITYTFDSIINYIVGFSRGSYNLYKIFIEGQEVKYNKIFFNNIFQFNLFKQNSQQVLIL